jgi:hypothetical protein
VSPRGDLDPTDSSDVRVYAAYGLTQHALYRARGILGSNLHYGCILQVSRAGRASMDGAPAVPVWTHCHSQPIRPQL